MKSFPCVVGVSRGMSETAEKRVWVFVCTCIWKKRIRGEKIEHIKIFHCSENVRILAFAQKKGNTRIHKGSPLLYACIKSHIKQNGACRRKHIKARVNVLWENINLVSRKQLRDEDSGCPYRGSGALNSNNPHLHRPTS